MSNSGLVNYTKLSPNNSGARTHSIDRITPHCVVGQMSVEDMGAYFAKSSTKASCNYGIGKDGRVLLCVNEGERSWCSSSNANDQRAVTIECACDKTDPYAFNDAVYNKLIELCADICKRNGKSKCIWISDKATALAYTPKSDEMLLTVHRWFKNKACPGDWMFSRMAAFATAVTAKIGGTSSSSTTTASTPTATASSGYSVGMYKVTTALNIRAGAGTSYAINGTIRDNGTYTITAISGDWGKLKSGAGWINLKYCTFAGASSAGSATASATTSTTKAANPYKTPTRNIKLTSPMQTGEDVKWVQWELVEAGHSITIDGYFGQKSKAALITYQTAHGLTADGICGKNTRAAMKAD